MIKNISQSEANQALHLMNKVFRKNFRKLLPKIYKDNSFIDSHFAYKEDKILGVIGNLPVNFQYKNTTVNCKGIGMVSVLKKARGKGIMSKMMNHCVKVNQEDTDVMFLTGNRQRYEFFGFVPAGQETKYFIFKHNINKIECKNNYEFLMLKDNLEFLPKVKESFYSQTSRFDRPEEKFLDVLNSWHNKTYVILKNGEYFGYFNRTKFVWNIQEIIINNEDSLTEILSSLFLKKKLIILYVTLPYFKTKYASILEGFSDRYAICTNCNIKIVNFKTAIEKLLNIKAKYTNLLDGKLILEIDKVCYSIEVTDNIAYVNTTNEEAEYKFTESQATTFLMSPKGSIHKNELVNNYFPLLFSVPHIDNV